MVQPRREANAMRLFMFWIPRMALVPDILPQLGGAFAFYSDLDDAAVAAGAPTYRATS
jgi:hypothetical protein